MIKEQSGVELVKIAGLEACISTARHRAMALF
jgi:hypothetical protein